MWRQRSTAMMITMTALGATLSSDAMNAASSWTLSGEHSGIAVFTRPHSGSDITEVKAVGKLPQTPERLFAVVHDVERYDEFFPFTSKSSVLRTENERRLLYQLVDPPLLDARDFFVWVSDDSQSGPTGPLYRSTWTLAQAYVDKDTQQGIVRVTDMAGQWQIRAAPGNPEHAEVTYWTYTNPGGAIPAGVLNAANTRVIPQIFSAILSRSRRSEYAPDTGAR